MSQHRSLFRFYREALLGFVVLSAICYAFLPFNSSSEPAKASSTDYSPRTVMVEASSAPVPSTRPDTESRPLSLGKLQSIYFDDPVELEEFLGAILALEHAQPVVSRSMPTFYRHHANRYILASRELTDIKLREFCPDDLPRLMRLRTAVDAFAEAMPEVASAHVMAASGHEREVRMRLVQTERLIREEALRRLPSRGSSADSSPEINLTPLIKAISSAQCCYVENLSDGTDVQEHARLQRARIINALAPIQRALTEWPPEFAGSIEADLQSWVRQFLPPAE